MSFGKSSGSSSSTSTENQTQNQSGTQTTTPNNLPYVQQGWNAATDLLSGTNGNSTNYVNNGLSLTATGANNASTAANGGLTTATNLANGGTANPANTYLTPYADGSMTGNNNPDFQNVVNQIAQSAQAATDGNFAAAGRYGSGANANAFNSAVANEAGQLGYANYNQSVQNQLNAANQLSQNNANSQNQALVALGLVPNLGEAATNAGTAETNAGYTPTLNFANLLSLLGSGGGTENDTSTGTSNTTGTENDTENAAGLRLSINPFGSVNSSGQNIFQVLGI